MIVKKQNNKIDNNIIKSVDPISLLHFISLHTDFDGHHCTMLQLTMSTFLNVWLEKFTRLQSSVSQARSPNKVNRKLNQATKSMFYRPGDHAKLGSFWQPWEWWEDGATNSEIGIQSGVSEKPVAAPRNPKTPYLSMKIMYWFWLVCTREVVLARQRIRDELIFPGSFCWGYEIWT